MNVTIETRKFRQRSDLIKKYKKFIKNKEKIVGRVDSNK